MLCHVSLLIILYMFVTLNPITLFCPSPLEEFFFVLLKNYFIFVFMNTVFYSNKDIDTFLSFYLCMWSLFPSIMSVDVIGCLLFFFLVKF